MKKFFISAAAVVTVGALVLVGCPEENTSPTTYPYVCENGTAATGAATTENVSNCTACTGTYVVVGGVGTEGSVCAYPYICENGTAADPAATTTTTTTENVSNCTACTGTHMILGEAGVEGSTCAEIVYPYICENGTAATATTNTANVSNCTACIDDYVVVGGAGTAGSVCAYPFICENGTAADPVATTTTENVSNCAACINDNYTIMGGVAGTVGTTCVQTAFSYICENGDAAPGTTNTANVSNCTACTGTYVVVGGAGTEGSVCAYPFICENGTAADPVATTTTENVSNCAACINDDYSIMGGVAGTVGTTCVQTAFPYMCTNGMPSAGRSTSADTNRCALCDLGFSPSGTLNADGSTCTAISGCTAPITGTNASVSTIYADGNYAGCSALTLAATGFGVFSTNNTATFTPITSGGANGTSNAYTFNNPTASIDTARGFITLAGDTDVSKKTLRFSIMSPATGGTSMVRVYLQADPGGNTLVNYQTDESEGIVTFTRDGTWQDVSINIDTVYAFGRPSITAANVRTIGFAITEDTNGAAAGRGVQTFSVDEVRLEDHVPNCTAPAMGDASVDLVRGDAVYSSCSEISDYLYTARHVPSRNAQSRPPSPLTLTTSSLGGGASSTPLFNTLTLGSGNSAYAYAIANLPANYNLADEKILKFSIKSPPTGGPRLIGVFFEDDTGDRTNTLNVRFINDGTWREVSFDENHFLFGSRSVDRTAIRRIVISLIDDNGLSIDGIGAQTFDIDEIRFE